MVEQIIKIKKELKELKHRVKIAKILMLIQLTLIIIYSLTYNL